MTVKERWLAALKLQGLDRLPFWPKIDNSYLRAHAARFPGWQLKDLHTWIGSDRHQWLTGFITEKRKDTYLEQKEENKIFCYIYRTKYGDLTGVMKFDEPSQSWHPVEFPLKKRDDIKIMTEWFKDACQEIDEERLARAKQEVREIGSEAITAQSIGTTPLMQWVQHLAGIENCHYFLADYKDEVAELFDVLEKRLLKNAEILAEKSPADILYLVENTSTTLISPWQYRAYCYPHILECCQVLKNSQKLLVLHMCGHLKALLPDLAKLPVAGFEAFTSPPVGNTTLLEGRTICPDKCLIGGTNAILWTKPAETIIKELEKELHVLPHHRGIVVTSAGVMPPLCQAETIKKVCTWVKSYPLQI